MNNDRKKIIALVSALAVFLLFLLIPPFKGLTPEATRAIGVLLAALILWISEALPMAVTTLLLICGMAFEQIMSFNEAMASIGTNTALFILASSGLTVAIANSSLPRRMTGYVVRRANGKEGLLVIGIGLLVTLCSAFMSSLATCALFCCIVANILESSGVKKGYSNLGRCLMLAIPACAGIGGFMSPAGTPANILLLQIFSENGVVLSFGTWCLIGFPLGLTAAVLFLVSTVIIFKPESLPNSSTHLPVPEKEKLSQRDIMTVVITTCVITGWFLSGWIKGVSTTMIAVLGLAAMFLPRIEVLTWKRFSDGVNWDLIITMGTVSVLMTGISGTGLIAWMASGIFGGLSGMSPYWMLAATSLAICIIRAFIPTTTAVVALLAPMLIGVAAVTGQSIPVLLMILAFWSASAMLLVYTEPIYLITYGQGYYRATDLLKVGTVPTILMAVLTAALIPPLMRILNIY